MKLTVMAENPSQAFPVTPMVWCVDDYIFTTVNVSCRWLSFYEWLCYCEESGLSPEYCGKKWVDHRVFFFLPATQQLTQQLYGVFIQVVEVHATRRSVHDIAPPPGLGRKVSV